MPRKLMLHTFLTAVDASPSAPKWFRDFYAAEVAKLGPSLDPDDDQGEDHLALANGVQAALEMLDADPEAFPYVGAYDTDCYATEEAESNERSARLFLAFRANIDDPGNYESAAGHWSPVASA